MVRLEKNIADCHAEDDNDKDAESRRRVFIVLFLKIGFNNFLNALDILVW